MKLVYMFERLVAFIGLISLLPLLAIALLIGLFDTGSPVFIQQRVGKNKVNFNLIKLRTMKINSPSVASHMADRTMITKYGSFLRKTKLDELPQLINVIMGDMSLVGPRPNLPSQEKLIHERDRHGVYEALPGITGLAQIRNIDMSNPELLAKTDKKMLHELNVKTYLKYILATITGAGSGDVVGK